MQEIFDRKAIFNRLGRINFDSSLQNKIAAEVLEELDDYLLFFCKNIDAKHNIMQILPHNLAKAQCKEFNLQENDKTNIVNIENLPQNNGIVAINCLHNVNYLQEYLLAIFKNLNDGGFFCGNFFGVNNLLHMKNIIHASDDRHSKQIYPRFNPAISGENLYAILQSIGFKNVVISVGKIGFDFNSFTDAMVFLKNINERNYVLARQKNAPRRIIFQENRNNKLKLDFEIIKFYCHKK